MKIKLIMTGSSDQTIFKKAPLLPLTLTLIAASAPEHEYIFVDIPSGDEINYDKKVDAVGISVFCNTEKQAFAIADEFRKRNITVILGGPQVSALPFEAIRHADCVVIGEGEQLWPIILNDIINNQLRYFYINSKKSFNPENYSSYHITSSIELARLPSPVHEYAKHTYTFDTIYASRGCTGSCDFCFVPGMFGENFRLRMIEDVAAEINTITTKYFYLIDDSVFGKSQTWWYYKQLYSEIARSKKKKLWIGQANCDAAAYPNGRDVIQTASDAGLLYVEIGIESLNFKTLEKNGALHKLGVNSGSEILARIRDNISFIQDTGIIVSGWFMIGYEDDSVEDYYKTLEFCQKTNIIPVILPLQAIPGTPLYFLMQKRGLIVQRRFNNIYHNIIMDEDIAEALNHIKKTGYSISANLKRKFFYFSRFKSKKMEKMKFLNMLHSRLKYIS